MIRRPPRSTLFPTRRSSDLLDDANRVRAAETKLGEGDVSAAVRALTSTDTVAPSTQATLETLRRLHPPQDRKSTRLNSSHGYISYAVFCLKKKKKIHTPPQH